MKILFNHTLNFLKKRFDAQSKILFKNSSWIFFANFIGTGIGFFRSIIIARGLGAEIFGIYLIIIAFVSTVQEIFNLNVGIAVIKFGAAYKTENRIDKLMALVKGCLLANLIGASISILVIMGVILFFYGKFISHSGLEWYIFVYAVAASTSFINGISLSLLRLYYKFKLNSAIQIIIDIAEFILIAIAIYFSPENLPLFFTMIIISRFLNTVIINFAAFWELRHELTPYFKSKMSLIGLQYREIRNFIIHNSLTNSLKTLKEKGDVLMLGAMAGAVPVAYYSIAKRLAYSLLTITDPLTSSIYPQLSLLTSSKENDKIKKMLAKLSKTILLPSLIFIILAYFLKTWIITGIYGKDYLGAAEPFFYLLIASVQGAVFFWNVSLIQSLGLVKYRLIIFIYSMIIGAAIAFFLIPFWSATGMAVGMLISNIFITFSFLYVSFKHLNENSLRQPFDLDNKNVKIYS